MCDNFRDNEWKPLPPLDDEDKDTLFKALNMAVTHTVRSELDAETEDDRKYYLEQEAKFKNLTTKLFDPKKHTPWWKPQSPKESKWRPFRNVLELIQAGITVGSVIGIRLKDSDSKNERWEARAIITEVLERHDGTCIVIIGRTPLGMDLLFEEYEYCKDLGEWRPFGVEE